jgi:pimeloyl-ACP methyl ester carboxylesterase
MQYVSKLIERGWNVCLFDFSGSGQSEGQHISLGHYEARDLDSVVKHVREKGNKKILLWGRSMGAVTSTFCPTLSNLLPQPDQVPRRHLRLRPRLPLRFSLATYQAARTVKIKFARIRLRASLRLCSEKNQRRALFRYKITRTHQIHLRHRRASAFHHLQYG